MEKRASYKVKTPPKQRPDNRGRQVVMDDAFFAQVKAAAKHKSMSTSCYVRQCIIAAGREGLV